jgi:hypothetical protein
VREASASAPMRTRSCSAAAVIFLASNSPAERFSLAILARSAVMRSNTCTRFCSGSDKRAQRTTNLQARARGTRAGPDREAFDHGDAGYAQALQRFNKAIELRFIGDAIVPADKLPELGNIGDESLADSAAEHTDRDADVSINLRTGRGEPVVHRHRVARPWPVEQNTGHCAGNTRFRRGMRIGVAIG